MAWKLCKYTVLVKIKDKVIENVDASKSSPKQNSKVIIYNNISSENHIKTYLKYQAHLMNRLFKDCKFSLKRN